MRKRATRQTADILLTLLVAAAALSLTWAGLRSSNELAAAVNADMSGIELPEDAIVIVVDAGHGGYDGGATGCNTGISEAELNLEVARLLESELTARGFYVIMTRENEGALAGKKSEDMRIRADIMRLPQVDMVVSIHMNKFSDSAVSGPMVFYMKDSESGKSLAECVISSICSETGRPPRYANPEDLFVLREPSAPSILVECGFLSNANDEVQLCSGEYQKKLAKAIASGINDYAAITYLKSGDGH